MPTKLTTFCYVHDSTDWLTQEYTIKEITGITRIDGEDPTKVIYLKIKAFIPSDQNIKMKIEDFEVDQVNITSIKLMRTLNFNIMPSINVNVTVIIGLTIKTVTNTDDQSTLHFYIEENIKAIHDTNNRYLANKTNSINQSIRSTTAILVAQQINTSICNLLPVFPNNFLLSQASDFVNSDHICNSIIGIVTNVNQAEQCI
ncbi:hypothetical protein C1646_709891 [Rhizophagus diaphanus]|nr:hypothetical protein C1646_709891 [Rhizophagus diaphanus] [Rhizophagus sp. MUCL 43196]